MGQESKIPVEALCDAVKFIDEFLFGNLSRQSGSVFQLCGDTNPQVCHGMVRKVKVLADWFVDVAVIDVASMTVHPFAQGLSCLSNIDRGGALGACYDVHHIGGRTRVCATYLL